MQDSQVDQPMADGSVENENSSIYLSIYLSNISTCN